MYSYTHTGVPVSPLPPVVTPVSPDAVDILMTTPTPGVNEEGAFYYDIQYTSLPDSEPSMMIEVPVPGGGAYTRRLGGLVQGTTYVFEVRARNMFGASAFVMSDPLFFNGKCFKQSLLNLEGQTFCTIQDIIPIPYRTLSLYHTGHYPYTTQDIIPIPYRTLSLYLAM